jgi:hypothetical protein
LRRLHKGSSADHTAIFKEAADNMNHYDQPAKIEVRGARTVLLPDFYKNGVQIDEGKHTDITKGSASCAPFCFGIGFRYERLMFQS